MALIWNDKKTSLLRKGRYFRNGDPVPVGILTDERRDEFLRKGILIDDKKKITEKPAEKAEAQVIKNQDKKSGKKSLFKNEEPETEETEPVKDVEDDLK